MNTEHQTKENDQATDEMDIRRRDRIKERQNQRMKMLTEKRNMNKPMEELRKMDDEFLDPGSGDEDDVNKVGTQEERPTNSDRFTLDFADPALMLGNQNKLVASTPMQNEPETDPNTNEVAEVNRAGSNQSTLDSTQLGLLNDEDLYRNAKTNEKGDTTDMMAILLREIKKEIKESREDFNRRMDENKEDFNRKMDEYREEAIRDREIASRDRENINKKMDESNKKIDEVTVRLECKLDESTSRLEEEVKRTREEMNRMREETLSQIELTELRINRQVEERLMHEREEIRKNVEEKLIKEREEVEQKMEEEAAKGRSEIKSLLRVESGARTAQIGQLSDKLGEQVKRQDDNINRLDAWVKRQSDTVETQRLSIEVQRRNLETQQLKLGEVEERVKGCEENRVGWSEEMRTRWEETLKRDIEEKVREEMETSVWRTGTRLSTVLGNNEYAEEYLLEFDPKEQNTHAMRCLEAIKQFNGICKGEWKFKLAKISKKMKGSAAIWMKDQIMSCCESYEEFERKFKEEYWNEDIQREFEIFLRGNGKFVIGKDTIYDYVMSNYKKYKYLDANIGMKNFLLCINRHVPINLFYLIGPEDSVETEEELIKRMKWVEKVNQPRQFTKKHGDFQNYRAADKRTDAEPGLDKQPRSHVIRKTIVEEAEKKLEGSAPSKESPSGSNREAAATSNEGKDKGNEETLWQRRRMDGPESSRYQRSGYRRNWNNNRYSSYRQNFSYDRQENQSEEL